MAQLMLSAMGAFAEFERALLKERQREGIAQAKRRGAYRGRKPSLNAQQIAELKQRVADGEQKTQVARDLGVSRQTVYQYLRQSAQPCPVEAGDSTITSTPERSRSTEGSCRRECVSLI